MSEEEKVKQATREGAAPEAEQPAQPEQTAEAAVDVGALQRELEEARGKAQEHWDQVLRLQAEVENQRRRAVREVENAHKYALERFAQELLPVKDSLELGLAATSGEGGVIQKLREGTELTLKMLAAALEKFGIREVNPLGQPFDPQLHQAMSMQENADKPANTVVGVMQKGYVLHDRLIRPAMVIVSKAPPAENTPTIDEQA